MLNNDEIFTLNSLNACRPNLYAEIKTAFAKQRYDKARWGIKKIALDDISLAADFIQEENGVEEYIKAKLLVRLYFKIDERQLSVVASYELNESYKTIAENIVSKIEDAIVREFLDKNAKAEEYADEHEKAAKTL